MLSNVFLLVFIVGCGAGIAFSVLSLSTPGWFAITDEQHHQVQSWDTIWSCLKPDDKNYCKNIWNEAGDWMKATIALMVIALLIALAAIVWAFLVCFTCCLTSCLAPPLPMFMVLTFVSQMAGCIIYGVKVKNFQGIDIKHPIDSLGYSFVLAIVACLIYFLDIIIGGVVVAFGGL